MITKLPAPATHRMPAGRPGRIALALAAILAVSGMTLTDATLTPAGAGEPKMSSSKSKLLRDRDNVTVIIIDKDDRHHSRSTSPARVDAGSRTQQSDSRVRRDNDTIYIRRSASGSHTTGSGPKVIIVDKDRGTSCSGSGVCVIRP